MIYEKFLLSGNFFTNFPVFANLENYIRLVTTVKMLT